MMSHEVYRCKECGWICSAEPSGSIGKAHAHAEKHARRQVLGFSLPAWFWPVANPSKLAVYIEKLKITDYEVLEQEAER